LTCSTRLRSHPDGPKFDRRRSPVVTQSCVGPLLLVSVVTAPRLVSQYVNASGAEVKFLLCLFVLTACAWAKPLMRAPKAFQPNFAYTVGPGTIVSVRLLDLPFGKRRCVVTYQSDAGQIFEIWQQPEEEFPLLKGMHGFLTYTMNPEQIISFRVTQPQNSTGLLSVYSVVAFLVIPLDVGVTPQDVADKNSRQAVV
jgi:hypothetical protein